MPANIEAWVALLVQVPLVGVFIWYSLKKDDRSAQSQQAFMDALDRRDTAFEKRNFALIETVSAMNASILTALSSLQNNMDEHDRYTREKLDRASGSRATTKTK